ncbi:MAG: hypothetical protein J0M00_06140 [Burkholderiales bacterium]|nr:hypothetical protein [Burkholderiales bacterium]
MQTLLKPVAHASSFGFAAQRNLIFIGADNAAEDLKAMPQWGEQQVQRQLQLHTANQWLRTTSEGQGSASTCILFSAPKHGIAFKSKDRPKSHPTTWRATLIR